MATLREFFTREATDLLARLNDTVHSLEQGAHEVDALLRDARALRGSAQMAREDDAYGVAQALEEGARSLVSGALRWNSEVASRTRASLDALAALVAGPGSAQAVAQARESVVGWRNVGVSAAAEPVATVGPADRDTATSQFLQFATHEIAGIVAELDQALEQLTVDPRNRDPLKAILRRQRALLGSARIDEVPVVAETLRAIDDIARLIAKLNVAVKDEWLAVFRSAREALGSSLDSLRQGDLPAHTPAVSRLRTQRQELTERHAESDSAVSRPAPPRSPDDVVPIDDLCYRGERALQRALELRPQLEPLAAADATTRETLEELFDLIRLGST